MATSIRIVWNIPTFRRIRIAPGVQKDIERRALAVADAAGDGYLAVATEQPRNRARAAVVTADGHARADNARNHTLLRALDAGRD